MHKNIKKSLIPSLVVISVFVLYTISVVFIIWLSSIGGLGDLADLGYFILVSLMASFIIFIFGLWAMISGYKEQKTKKIVLLWVIPTFIIFLIQGTLFFLLVFAALTGTINVK